MGGFLGENPQYLGYMPAAVQISAQTGHDMQGGYPVTVNEGKNYLRGLIDNAKIPQPQTLPELKNKAAPLIECKNLWFRYEKGAPDVLKDLSLKAYAGELSCIHGENCSGKSTHLKLLAGLLKPVRGNILLGGENISKLGGRGLYLNNLALLPQNPKALFVCDSLLEDLKASATAAGVTDDGEIDVVASELGLEGLLRRHPYDLSGGESKRAALAKLLLTHPRLLLLDEPTSGLDAYAKASLAATLRALCEKGAGVLIITHDMEFAAEYAHRCLLLFDGGAAGEGTPGQFFGGNFFYTTAANRMVRDIDAGAITCGDVIKLCKSVR
jgi:energy-coupling factor transport system ATP-binding protein